MNRIILIGNGFDLAHGLPTSYGNFIEWYWRKWRSELRCSTYSTLKDELCEFSLKYKNSGWLAYLFTNQMFLSSGSHVGGVDRFEADELGGGIFG